MSLLLKQASAYLFAHALAAALGFLSVILFTRMLSPAEYGVYVVALVMASVVVTFLYNWIKLAALRMQSEGGGVDIRATSLVALGASTLLMPVCIAAAILAVGMTWQRALAGGCLALALGFFDLGQEIFKARQDTAAYVRATVLRALGSISIAYLLVYSGFGGIGLIAGVIGGYFLASLAMAPRLWRRPVRAFDREAFKSMVLFGMPMAGAGALFAVHAALDRLALSALLGDHAAGAYGAPADLVRQMIVFPSMSVAAAMIPSIIRSYSSETRERIDHRLLQSGEFFLAVVTPVAVGFALVAPHVAALVLGPEFREAAVKLIPVLSIACLVQAFSQHFFQVSFYIAKTPRLLVVLFALILATNAVALGPLITAYGLVGAAYACLLAETAGIGIALILARRAHPMPNILPAILRVGFAAALMAVPTHFVARMLGEPSILSLVITAACGAIVYALAIVALDVAGVRHVGLARVKHWLSARSEGSS